MYKEANICYLKTAFLKLGSKFGVLTKNARGLCRSHKGWTSRNVCWLIDLQTGRHSLVTKSIRIPSGKSSPNYGPHFSTFIASKWSCATISPPGNKSQFMCVTFGLRSRCNSLGSLFPSVGCLWVGRGKRSRKTERSRIHEGSQRRPPPRQEQPHRNLHE